MALPGRMRVQRIGRLEIGRRRGSLGPVIRIAAAALLAAAAMFTAVRWHRYEIGIQIGLFGLALLLPAARSLRGSILVTPSTVYLRPEFRAELAIERAVIESVQAATRRRNAFPPILMLASGEPVAVPGLGWSALDTRRERRARQLADLLDVELVAFEPKIVELSDEERRAARSERRRENAPELAIVVAILGVVVAATSAATFAIGTSAGTFYATDGFHVTPGTAALEADSAYGVWGHPASPPGVPSLALSDSVITSVIVTGPDGASLPAELVHRDDNVVGRFETGVAGDHIIAVEFRSSGPICLLATDEFCAPGASATGRYDFSIGMDPRSTPRERQLVYVIAALIAAAVAVPAAIVWRRLFSARRRARALAEAQGAPELPPGVSLIIERKRHRAGSDREEHGLDRSDR